MSDPPAVASRNPGPPCGYELLAFADRILPRAVFAAGLRCGAAIAVLLMKRQRKASSDFLLAATGRRPCLRDNIRHFEVFAGMLVERLRLSRGVRPRFCFADTPARGDFEALCRSGETALFGTFHVGQSDLLGCMLGDFGRKVALVRHRVANALDTEFIERGFAGSVKILWINEKESFLFEMKDALDRGLSVGLQCDRIEFGGRLQEFEFFGSPRKFPFTIYHLAVLLGHPVGFAFAGVRQADGCIPVIAAPVFRPQEHANALDAARDHFRGVLDLLTQYLREHPFVWFNFGDSEIRRSA